MKEREFFKLFLKEELKRVDRLIKEYEPLSETMLIMVYLNNQRHALIRAIKQVIIE